MNNDLIINFPLDFFSIIYQIIENTIILLVINFFINFFSNNVFGNLLFSYTILYLVIIKINEFAVYNKLDDIILYSSKFFALLSFKLIYKIIHSLM